MITFKSRLGLWHPWGTEGNLARSFPCIYLSLTCETCGWTEEARQPSSLECDMGTCWNLFNDAHLHKCEK